MNPFVSRINNQPWIWPITGMCLVLGFMISMAWVTDKNRTSRIGLVSPDLQDRVRVQNLDNDNLTELQLQVNKLQTKITKLENALANQSGQAKILNDSLQELKVFAGMTEVEGSGVTVTLRDDPNNTTQATALTPSQPNQQLTFTSPNQIIHDTDVLRVVNELFAAGAEAISVNDIRISAGSSFRCVGPTILVNDMKIASPVRIAAIGDSNTLFGGMNLPGGVLDEIRQQNQSMVQIQKVQKMRLPGFVGNTTKRIAKVPKDKK